MDELTLLDSVKELKPTRVAAVDVAGFVFSREFRTLCEANHCGYYNKKWTCPPHVGEVEDLVAEARTFNRAVVYQLVGTIAHSFDWKGILAVGEAFNRISIAINDRMVPTLGKAKLLGAGHCQICSTCAFSANVPCRFPGRAIRSLEANCVDVKALADLCGMRFTNGQNTVTLFGAILFDPSA
jgi:predicted metal-binding protein